MGNTDTGQTGRESNIFFSARTDARKMIQRCWDLVRHGIEPGWELLDMTSTFRESSPAAMARFESIE